MAKMARMVKEEGSAIHTTFVSKVDVSKVSHSYLNL